MMGRVGADGRKRSLAWASIMKAALQYHVTFVTLQLMMDAEIVSENDPNCDCGCMNGRAGSHMH